MAAFLLLAREREIDREKGLFAYLYECLRLCASAARFAAIAAAAAAASLTARWLAKMFCLAASMGWRLRLGDDQARRGGNFVWFAAAAACGQLGWLGALAKCIPVAKRIT